MLRVAADQNGKDREKKRINGTIKKKELVVSLAHTHTHTLCIRFE